MAEPRALLLVAVDPLLRRVDVDEGQDVRAGQQRRCRRQPGQEPPAGLLRAAGRSPGIAAQVRAERGRGADPAEQRVHRPVPQQAHVIDGVGARGHARDQAADLQVRVHPALAARADVLREQFRQAGPLGEGHHRAPGRHATRDSGHRTRRWSARGYATIALARCPLGMGDGSVENYHHPSSEGTFRVPAPETTLKRRWIEA